MKKIEIRIEVENVENAEKGGKKVAFRGVMTRMRAPLDPSLNPIPSPKL